MSDLSNGSWNTTDGSNTTAPPQGWPAGMAANAVEGVGQAMMGGTKRWWERANCGISTTGSSPSYVLTPTNTSYPTAYTQGEIYGFKANFTSVGSDTLNVNSLGAKGIYIRSTGGQTAITAGAIRSGDQCLVAYDAALNSGGGGFQLLTAVPGSGGGGATVSGNIGAVDAQMSVTTAGTTATITAVQVTTYTALSGTAYLLTGYSQAVNLATTGAGGMDTGTAPVSGHVSLYAINKADGTKNILACNAATSSAEVYGGGSMPAGYVASALLSIWPTNGSSQFVVGFQRDRGVNFVPTSTAFSTFDTSYHSLGLTAIVPNAVKTISGWFFIVASASNTVSAKLATTSAGVGEQRCAIQAAGASPVYVYSPFSGVQIIGQTVYYSATGTSGGIEVSGYTF